jgi:hypothetical protein
MSLQELTTAADAGGMRLAARQFVGVLLVAAMLLVTVGVFTFARPAYHSPNESATIDFAKEHHYPLAAVKRAFAAHGIVLHSGATSAGFVWLGATPPPFRMDSLQVLVAPRNGRGSWGPEVERYDERFGNVFVTYGGHDDALLARIKAAVSDIRKHS